MLRVFKGLENPYLFASDSETESDDLITYFKTQKNTKGKGIEQETTGQSVKKWKEDLETLLRRAEMYQDYMKEIPIPTVSGPVIPYHTWQELGKSLKQLYKQPLHYLTNVQLKQWDKARINTKEEQLPMDTFVHPAKAAATIWIIEEIHRRNTSHHFLARLWLNDPLHRAFIDPFSQP